MLPACHRHRPATALRCTLRLGTGLARHEGGWHAGARPGPPGAAAWEHRRCCHHAGPARTGRPTAAVTAPGH
jgi:hypothetical protein